MTEHQKNLLDGLDTMPVGSAPVDALLVGGKAAERRQRRTFIAGVAAATLLVIGGGAVATQAILGTGGQRGDDSPVANGPNDADGSNQSLNDATRPVGIGGAYVEVPAEWGSNDASCNTPIRDTYYFPYGQDCQAGVTPRVSSVAIATGEFTEADIRTDRLRSAGELDGHEVLESPATCELSDPGLCTQTFAIPDVYAYFHVAVWSDDGGDEVVHEIRESLTLLDTDQTIVPFTPYGTETQVVAALEDAGLPVQIVRTSCPPTADCLAGVTGIEPAVGTVVPTGSNVTVTVHEPVASNGKGRPSNRLVGDWEELTHTGFLELSLGMSQQAALDTGRITLGETDGKCTGFYLAMYGDGSGLNAHGYFTEGAGLSVIYGQDEMHTSEDIGLGDDFEDVLNSYAHIVGGPDFATASTSDTARYFFVAPEGVVSRFGLSVAGAGDECIAKGWEDPASESPSPAGTEMSISSHCGVHSAWVKGELWLADPPLGGHNPPPGWDENATTGVFVVTSKGQAKFLGDGGQQARFRLAEPNAEDPNAGCE